MTGLLFAPSGFLFLASLRETCQPGEFQIEVSRKASQLVCHEQIPGWKRHVELELLAHPMRVKVESPNPNGVVSSSPGLPLRLPWETVNTNISNL
jgi:hypothetical protein